MAEATPHAPADVDDASAGVDVTAASSPGDSPSFFGHVIVVALASGFFALVWFVVYTTLDSLIWDNELVESYWWLPPLLIMTLSLAVGLAVRYLHAPTSMDGSLLDEMTGDPTNIRWRRLPVTVLQATISLLAGAVVGPEGALGRFAGMIAEWYSERLHVPMALRGRLVFAAASSAYNGLLANPLFTAILGVDVARTSSAVWSALPSH